MKDTQIINYTMDILKDTHENYKKFLEKKGYNSIEITNRIVNNFLKDPDFYIEEIRKDKKNYDKNELKNNSHSIHFKFYQNNYLLFKNLLKRNYITVQKAINVLLKNLLKKYKLK